MDHILIIGGTKGLGKVFTEAARSAYKTVSVVARTVPEQKDGEENLRYVAADVTATASLLAALRQILAAGGKIDGVVFFQQYRGKEESWSRKLACTLTATREALEFLRDHFSVQGDKSVVFITSIASRFVADEQDDAYHAAKTALLGLCRYYAFKLGHIGVRVNCVSPGTVLKEENKHHFLKNPELVELFKEIIPLRRMGTAEEVVSVIKFLLSSDASFINGQEIVVDGGVGLHSQESLARSLFYKHPVQ